MYKLMAMLLYSLSTLYENFRCAIKSRDQLYFAEVLKVKIIEECIARKQKNENFVTALITGSSRQIKKRFEKKR